MESAAIWNQAVDEPENLSSTDDVRSSGEDSQESFSLLHPTKIGRYTILGRLGKGGFGEVFLAHDDDLNRPVAIKVPRPDRVSQPKDVEAYLNEARILASLDHPHIVPVYDVGRTEDGLCFVVSKFIEGSDLAKRIKESRLGFPRVGGTGRDGRRSPALCSYKGAGPSRHQAWQHPDRCLGKRIPRRLWTGPQGRGFRHRCQDRRDSFVHES